MSDIDDEVSVRDQHTGRFRKGHRGVKTDSTRPSRTERFRRLLLSTATGDDIRDLAGALLTKAKSGDTPSLRLALSYLIGIPSTAELAERLARLERQLKRV